MLFNSMMYRGLANRGSSALAVRFECLLYMLCISYHLYKLQLVLWFCTNCKKWRKLFSLLKAIQLSLISVELRWIIVSLEILPHLLIYTNYVNIRAKCFYCQNWGFIIIFNETKLKIKQLSRKADLHCPPFKFTTNSLI